jgi:hypothetical protein
MYVGGFFEHYVPMTLSHGGPVGASQVNLS